MTALELKDKIIAYLEDKKGTDVTAIEITQKSSIADFFVIATGTSKTQVKALVDYVEVKLEEEEIRPSHTDGREGGAWLVLDYDNVIVHVFEKGLREEINLEKLWKEER